MADQVQVKVLRPVGGYAVGDKREMSAADAKRLADRGAVEIISNSKAEAPLQNKMEPAPSNKASTRAKGAAKRKGK